MTTGGRLPHHAQPSSWATPLELWYDLVMDRGVGWQERAQLFTSARWSHAVKLVDRLAAAKILAAVADRQLQGHRAAAVYTLCNGVSRNHARDVAQAIALELGPLP